MAINFAAASTAGLNNPGTEIITLVKDGSGNFINPPSYDKMREYLRSGEVPMLFVTAEGGETGSLYQLVEYSETENKIRFSNSANAIEFCAGCEVPNVSPAGGGASSADVFIIHVTENETYTNAQFDKTPEQIFEAYQSGKYCLADLDGAFVPVVSVKTHNAQTDVFCSGVFLRSNGQGRIISTRYTTTDGVTWLIENGAPPMLYDVCFNGLRIVGSGGRIYTISVDATGNITATLVTG